MAVEVIGRSEAHARVLAELASAAQTDIEVLILGPSGVGKELYAGWLHRRSARCAQPFVPLNCGGVPTGLFENEVFGHVRGAFTGAQPSSEGLIAEADGGTLFLDEIDTLDLAGQVKLLRFLQQREYRRLGESRLRRANVRIVAASNADLLRLVSDGRFREDLFFRIHVFPVRVPPLRERREDIEPLLTAYVEHCAQAYGCPGLQFTPEALARLGDYSWPGNVRELENCVRYLTARRLNRPIQVQDLKLVDELADPGSTIPLPSQAPPSKLPCLRDAKRSLVGAFERNYLVDALQANSGNIARAARASGKPRRTFYELMRKYGVMASDYRRPRLPIPQGEPR